MEARVMGGSAGFPVEMMSIRVSRLDETGWEQTMRLLQNHSLVETKLENTTKDDEIQRRIDVIY